MSRDLGSLNSNELLRYLQGFVETQTEPVPTAQQWAIIRAKVLEGHPITGVLMPEMRNTIPGRPPEKPCNCK